MSSLTLVPTPIDDLTPICSTAKTILSNAFENDDLILVEEHKIARRRWIHYGLPREAIDKFIIYNEHTYKEISLDTLKKIQSGKNAYLMSDCGLPAFCDPGRRLVEMCHDANIKVSSTPFANSIALAVALSGFEHEKFVFEGFVPAKSELRSKELKRIVKSSQMSVMMDTPYRLNKLVDELASLNPNREAFLGIDLNHETEQLIKKPLGVMSKSLPKMKSEFILLLRKTK